MQLCKKQKIFSEVFYALLQFTLNFEYFEKKDDPHSLCILDITDCEDGLRQMCKSLFSEDPSTGDIVNEHKHCRNMKVLTFGILNDCCEGN